MNTGKEWSAGGPQSIVCWGIVFIQTIIIDFLLILNYILTSLKHYIFFYKLISLSKDESEIPSFFVDKNHNIMYEENTLKPSDQQMQSLMHRFEFSRTISHRALGFHPRLNELWAASWCIFIHANFFSTSEYIVKGIVHLTVMRHEILLARRNIKSLAFFFCFNFSPTE